MKTFEQWDIDDVERTFGLRRQDTLNVLEDWLSAGEAATDEERGIIKRLQANLLHKIDIWNEDELKFKLIAPFVSIVNYDTNLFNSFTQRTLTATVSGITLSGRVDFVVATGKAKPIQPFFFLHEYKRTRGRENDPLAQLLAEMLAAQELNQHKYPLYGCYVQGRNWFFVVLDGREYAESLAFDATKDEIYSMLRIMKEAKAIITHLAEQVV
jgi:hypothetical protein